MKSTGWFVKHFIQVFHDSAKILLTCIDSFRRVHSTLNIGVGAFLSVFRSTIRLVGIIATIVLVCGIDSHVRSHINRNRSDRA